MKATTKSQVRPATAMDSVNIVRLLKQQHGESAARLIGPFEEQRALDFVSTVIRNCFAIVVEASGRLLGSAAIAPIPIPWSSLKAHGEAWFAVVPACRGKEVPQQLLAALGTFIDRPDNPWPLILGTNLLAPESFDDMLGARKDMIIGRTTYLRMPALSAKKEVA